MTIWNQNYIYQEENLRIMDVGAWIVIMDEVLFLLHNGGAFLLLTQEIREEILRRNEVGQHRLMKITWHLGKLKGSLYL